MKLTGKGGPVLCWSKGYKPTFGLKEDFFMGKSNTNEQLFNEAKAVMERIGLPVTQEDISKESWGFSTGVIHFDGSPGKILPVYRQGN